MPRPSRQSVALIIALLVALAGGCGGGDHEERPADGPASGSDHPRAQAEAPDPEPAAIPVPAPRAAREVLAAARASELEQRSFTTDLLVEAAGMPRLRATLRGLGRHGATSATATGAGIARAAVDGWELAIRSDHLYGRAAGDDRVSASRPAFAGWRDLGSASGVQLDVARELLTHPMLTQVQSARRRGDTLEVRLVVPAPALRAYAADERSGPVTDLLVRARELRVEATIRGGRIRSDRFTLLVGGGASGPAVRIEGSTTTSFRSDPDAAAGHPNGVEPAGPPPGAVPSGSFADLFPAAASWAARRTG